MKEKNKMKLQKIMHIKKLSSLLLAFLILTSLCSCASESELRESTLEHSYHDGTYYAQSSYYNNEGFTYVMDINISNSIINKVHFDALNFEDVSIFDTLEEEDSFNLKSEVNNYTSQLFENQHIDEVRNKDNSTLHIFSELARTLCSNAQNNIQQKIFVDFEFIYNIKSEADKDGNTTELTVSCKGDIVGEIDYKKTNLLQQEVSGDEVYLDEVEKLTGLSYDEILNNITLAPRTVEQLAVHEYDESQAFIYEKYNALAEKLITKIKPCQQEQLVQ